MARKKKSTSKSKRSRKRKSGEDRGKAKKGRKKAVEVATTELPVAETALADQAVEPLGSDASIEPIEDLDADLDTEIDSATAVGRLIAETLAVARAEDEAPTPAAPVLDLDTEGLPDAPASAQALGDDEKAGVREDTDVGPVSSPEVRARLLAEALAHAEHRDARYRVPFVDSRSASRWKALAATSLFLFAGAAALAPPEWVRPEAPVELDAAEEARSLRMALLLQAEQLEVFRVRSQRLPRTLGEVPFRLPGVRYVRSGNRAYQLIAYERDGSALIYDSASPALVFRSQPTVWKSAGSEP